MKTSKMISLLTYEIKKEGPAVYGAILGVQKGREED